MIHTSQAATEFFKSDLMVDHTEEMIEYSAGELFKEFYGKTLAAAVLPALGEMKTKHASILANGPLTADDGTTMDALSFPNDEAGLIVYHPSGERDLVAWGRDGKRSDEQRIVTNVYLIPLLPEMPRDLADQIETLLESEDAMLEAFAEVAPKAAQYAQMTDGTDAPSVLGDIVSLIEREGVRAVCGRLAAGWVIAITDPDGASPFGRGVARDFSHRIDLVERFMQTFESNGETGFDLRRHAALVKSGAAASMFGSVAANLFERSIVGHLDDLEEIATASRELRLGGGTVLAYNDTDIRISVDEFEGKIVYRHDNIDRNEQNVFVTVINKAGDQPQSIDIYIANSWSHDFATANGLEGEPLDRESFLWLIDDIRSEAGKLKEDVLVNQLEFGRPTEGLVYSYDLAAKTLEVFPGAASTGYLGYAPLMIECDLKALNKVRAGQSNGLGTEFQVRDLERGKDADVQHIKPAKYLRDLKPDEQVTRRF
jgi:hypothetical protein|nr:hypothetical protein [Neorhizobium tomejilense]